MTALDDVVAACRARLHELGDEGAVARKTRAIYRLVREEGHPPLLAAQEIEQRLRDEGLTDEEIDALGVGYDNIRRIAAPRSKPV